MGILRRNSEFEDLERRLHDERAEPPQHLVTSLANRVSSRSGGRNRGHRALRYGVAAGFAASLTVAFALAGGFGLVSASTRSTPRVSVAVPVVLVPTIRSLQASGARIAAAPIGVRVGAGAVSAVPGTGSLKPLPIKTIHVGAGGPIASADERPGDRTAERVRPTSRALVPQVTSSSNVVRFAALDVYNPPPDTVICLAIHVPPSTTYYMTMLVAAAVAPVLIAQNPGSYYGVCVVPPT